MKKITIVLFSLLTLMSTLSSCSSDDDKTEHTLMNGLCKHTHDLGIANAGSEVTSPVTTVTLDEMLKSYDYNPPITKGVLILTDGTSARISGLREGVVLENFTLTINNVKKDFGNITSDKVQLYNDANLQFFRDAFNRMISDRKLIVKATYKPSEKITDEDALKIDIVFKGNFTYWK